MPAAVHSCRRKALPNSGIPHPAIMGAAPARMTQMALRGSAKLRYQGRASGQRRAASRLSEGRIAGFGRARLRAPKYDLGVFPGTLRPGNANAGPGHAKRTIRKAPPHGAGTVLNMGARKGCGIRKICSPLWLDILWRCAGLRAGLRGGRDRGAHGSNAVCRLALRQASEDCHCNSRHQRKSRQTRRPFCLNS